MKHIYLLVIIFIFTGCSLKLDAEKGNNINTFTLADIHVEKFSHSSSQKSIKVTLPIGPRYLHTTKLAYKDGETFGVYQYNKWNSSPVKQLQYLLSSILRQRNFFKEVIISPSQVQYDVFLETRMDSFIYVNDEKNPYVKIEIEFFLVDTESKKTLKNRYFNIHQKVLDVSALNIVKAYNKALLTLSEDFTKWIEN